jgi:predicted secreted protein
MAIITGNDGKVRIGSTDLAAVRNFSIELTADTIETSTMGTDVRTYVKGMSTWSGSADIYFEDSEFGVIYANICDTATHAVGDPTSTIKLVLQDGASNDKWFSGNIIVTGTTVNSSMDGLVEASISFQGSGDLTFTTTGSYAA